MLPAVLILAAVTDSITMLALPVGSELNPLAANWPALAVAAKAVLVVALLRYRFRYTTPVLTFGAVAWSLGAASNLAVLTGG